MKKTIIDLFESSVEKYGKKTFLLEKRHHAFQPTTYAETREQALEVGAGLASLGIRPKDKVAILAEGSNGWIISELGIFYAGAISVPLSVKLEESNDLLFRLRHAEVKALFVSKQQLPKIRRIRAELPELEQIIVLGHIPLESGETAYGMLKRLGRDYLAGHKEEFLKIGQAIRNDDYATITYTSGTTADPKGVVLTHRNYTANVEQSLSRIDIPSSYRTLIILPLDHCFAHVVGFYIMIACGASVATVQIGATPMETLKNIPQNIREVKPNFLLSVPALAKNFRKSIESSIRAKGRMTEGLFRLALKTAYAYNGDGYRRGRGWRCVLRPVVALFDVTLFRTGILVTGDQRLAALQFDIGIEIEPGFRHQIGGEFYARDVVHRRLFHRNILVFDFERIGGRVHGALGALHHHAQIIVGLFHLLGIDQPLGRREIKGVAAVFFSDIDRRLDADEIASVVLDLIGQSYRRLLPGVGIVVGIVVIACAQHGCRCEHRARQRAQSVMGRVFHNDCF